VTSPHGTRIIYGRHPVEAVLQTRPSEVKRLWVANELSNGRDIVAARDAGVRVEVLPKDKLEALAKSQYHQGLVAEAAEFTYADVRDLMPGDRPGLVLALDSVQDPQNFGALVRSAECFGATGVLVPQDRAASVTGTAGKASAGAIERLPIARSVNLARALGELKEMGYWTTGLAGEAETLLPDVDLKGHTVVVVGAEGSGLRPVIRKACDFLARIPMTGVTGSLNASVAGGVALYEAFRQRSAGVPPKTA
jgi:23S rRNA (guanosine2251-2'-O)-methyltransferase